MNAKQFAYQSVRLFVPRMGNLYSGWAAAFGYLAVNQILNAQTFPSLTLGIALGVLSSHYLSSARYQHRFNRRFDEELAQIRGDHSLEHVSQIILPEESGIESLLAKTREGIPQEWGTVVNAHEEYDKAIIDHLVPAETAVAAGLIKKTTKFSIQFDKTRAINQGFNGVHHYHPNIL